MWGEVRREKIARPAFQKLFSSRRLSVVIVLWPLQLQLVLRDDKDQMDPISDSLATALLQKPWASSPKLSLVRFQERNHLEVLPAKNRIETPWCVVSLDSTSGSFIWIWNLRTHFPRQQHPTQLFRATLHLSSGGGPGWMWATIPRQHSPFTLQKHKSS